MVFKEDTIEPRKKAVGFRHLQAVLWSLAMTLGFIYRVNISMALVAMTDTDNDDAFDWPVSSQSTILSSFMWTYVISQFPGGELAAKFGGKMLLLICILSNVLVSFITPTCAYFGGWKLVCVCRAIQGLGQGVLMPSIHNLIGKWAPVEEKSRIGTFVYAGGFFGMGLQNFVSGYMINRWSWPAIFYINAITGFVWLIPFIIFGSDSPQTSRWISEEEKLYIQTSLGQIGGHKKLKTPWKKIWTSMPFISLIVANCAQNWGLWTLMTLMPMYLSQVQGVNIKSNGVMSAIPYMGILLMSFPFGYLADLVIQKKWLSLTATRKIFNSIGTFGPGLALVGLSYAPADVNIAVALLTVVMALNAGHFTGYLLGHVDMAPNFAGTMSGITNGFANVLSIFAPLAAGFILKDELGHVDMAPNFAGTMSGITNEFANVLLSIFTPLEAGFILKDETDPDEWRKVFYLSSGLYIGCNIFYIIFASSERQTWNEPEEGKSCETT